jgi:Ras GTPase-activating-like protein IQGAP2/3
LITLGIAQNALRELKQRISTQSKKNFLFEKDVRYLDARIALLIQNRLRIEEVGLHLKAVLETY